MCRKQGEASSTRWHLVQPQPCFSPGPDPDHEKAPSPRWLQACGVTLTAFLIFLPAFSPLQGTAVHARHPAEHLGEITY